MSPPVIYTSLCQYQLKLVHLRVSGPDAISFIQSQSTQKIDAQLRFHVFTDRFGKVLCPFLASVRSGAVELWCGQEALAAVIEKFEKFIISEEVEWSQPELRDVYFVFNGPVSESAGVWGGVSVELSHSPRSAAKNLEAHDFKSFMKWQGVPDITNPTLMGEVVNQTLLLPYAVDFKKGCFPGQEAVAKIQNLRGAAWAPVLIYKNDSNKEFPPEIKVNDKTVVQIDSNSIEGDWATGSALRDVRVHDLCLEGTFVVKLYPRWPATTPDRAREIYHWGTECFQRGDEAQALELWKCAIAVDPKAADAYEAIGVLLGRQEKFVEAESWMRKLLEVDPDSVMAHTNLSLFLMRQDKIKEAEDHKALATVASFKSFGRQASEKRAQEQKLEQERAELERRGEMFRQVLEIDPEDTLALHGMGGILMEKKNYTEALGYLEKVIQADPKYSVAYLALGKCYLELADTARAKDIFSRGIQVAAQKGDLMPANEMQSLLLKIN